MPAAPLPAQLAVMTPTARAPLVPSRLRLAEAAPPVRPRGPEQAVAAVEAPVSVTIGRVEIRATIRAPQPPAPVRPAAAAADALSLDAYLRRRDGGGG